MAPIGDHGQRLDGRYETNPTHTHISLSYFLQLPFRDYVDAEIAKVPDDHTNAYRVLWNGDNYLVFTGPEDQWFRWKIPTTKQNSYLWSYADKECRRLVTILEAMIVRDHDWTKLPVKVKVRGESYYSPLYSHPLNEVRYPVLGLNEHNQCGTRKRFEIAQWLERQGFDPEATQGEILGIIDSVLEGAESREKDWLLILTDCLTLPQIIMTPDDVRLSR